MHFSALKAAPLAAAGFMLLVATAPAAAQTATPSGWTPGPGAMPGGTYDGVVDAPQNGTPTPASGTLDVHGWFVDPSAQGWAGADQVQVFLGQMGNGGTMLAQGTVAENRPDVATALGNPYFAASGFDVQVPATSLPSGNQTLDVYLHTPGKGWLFQPVIVDVGAAAAAAPAPSSSTTTTATAATSAPQLTITEPTESQNVSTHSDFTITGNATSPGAGPSDIDRVDVYINGEKDTGTLLGETTPASDGSWSVGFTPTHFASTHSNIYVYAHSKSTGQETEVIRGFNIVDN